MNGQESVPLNPESLSVLRDRLPVPEYERPEKGPYILHLGVGGFHRAHMAYYTDELLRSGSGGWCIHGAGITKRDQKIAAVLQNQGCLYTLVARSSTTEEARVVGSITEYFYATDGTDALCRRVAEGDYRIISLTVTENGYHYTGDDRHLNTDDPDIAHDLEHPDTPRSVVGFLYRVAALRLERGRPLPTFLSCDNLPHNGTTLKNLVLQFARLIDPTAAGAIERSGCFPNTMVDRITPATTQEQTEYVERKWGIRDEWPVLSEDFIQWIIEDNFCDGRPPWEDVGATIVTDVIPYEMMKIRLLNGSHSALAYISYLLGFRDVDRAMADPDVHRFVREYMSEIEPSVGEVPGVDLKEYWNILVNRFSNPAIRDQVLRLAEDGSRKIPNMVLEPVEILLSRGQSCPFAAFALAAWIRFLKGVDEYGVEIPIVDPAATELTTAARQCNEEIEPFVSLDGIFSGPLRNSATFMDQIRLWYTKLNEIGARASLQYLLEEYGNG